MAVGITLSMIMMGRDNLKFFLLMLHYDRITQDRALCAQNCGTKPPLQLFRSVSSCRTEFEQSPSWPGWRWDLPWLTWLGSLAAVRPICQAIWWEKMTCRTKRANSRVKGASDWGIAWFRTCSWELLRTRLRCWWQLQSCLVWCLLLPMICRRGSSGDSCRTSSQL